MPYKAKLLLSFFSYLFLVTNAHAQFIINTVAGNGTGAYMGDNGLAINAELYGPRAICMDASGDLYMADCYNQTIRKIDHSSGIITTVAGIRFGGFSGDNGLAINAQFDFPVGVYVDKNENIYIADQGNDRIRMVKKTTGIITTIAGTGVQGFSGDSILAVNTQLNQPTSVCTDDSGNIYIADEQNNRIRMIDHQTNKIYTIAGTGIAGFSGDSGLAIDAQLDDPLGICLDASGNLYIGDNARIRKVDANTHIITTVVGNGTVGNSGDMGSPLNAEIGAPTCVYVDTSNNLYIVDEASRVIRKVDLDVNIITTVAGNGTFGFYGDMGDPVNAEFNEPFGLCIDATGNIYISDMYSDRIREIIDTSTTSVKKMPSQTLVEVYPNPSNGNFTINATLSNSKEAAIQILNALGQTVYQQTATLLSSKLNTQLHLSLAPGIYTLHVKGDGDTGFVQKLVL